MPYHIIKASRTYEGGGYEGISCQQAGVEPGKTYDYMSDAVSDMVKLTAVNPVGWTVYDIDTKKAVRVIVPKGGFQI